MWPVPAAPMLIDLAAELRRFAIPCRGIVEAGAPSAPEVGTSASRANVLRVAAPGSELAVLRAAAGALAGCDAVLARVRLAEPDPGVAEVEDVDAWLFDRGFVRVRTHRISAQDGEALYVASQRVERPFDALEARRGIVQVPDLGRKGRFANQLFQVAFAYFYALRSGAGLALPPWPEGKWFALPDFAAPANLPTMVLPNGNRDHLGFFELDRPPVDVGFSGYFQDLPPAVKRHRALFRRLLAFRPEIQALADAWTAVLTENGRRPLIALHVRRGDYQAVPLGTHPHARIPTEWYVTALRAELRERPDACVHVASDDPRVAAEILAAVGYRADPATPSHPVPPSGLADHIGDFHALSAADVSLICNSSYSRMAALLGRPGQRCLLADIATARFEPYDAWEDTAFWHRFLPARDARLFSLFDGCNEPAAIEQRALQTLVSADRLWAVTNRAALWWRTTGMLWALLAAPPLPRILWRLRPEGDPPVAECRKIEAAARSYWRLIRSGNLPPTLPRWRFLTRRRG